MCLKKLPAKSLPHSSTTTGLPAAKKFHAERASGGAASCKEVSEAAMRDEAFPIKKKGRAFLLEKRRRGYIT